MEKIAFVFGETYIYWHAILLTLAAVTAVCLYLAFWIGRGGGWVAGFSSAALAALGSLVLSRLAHWYFQAAGYPSFTAAMTDYSGGNFALMGAFAGCSLAALLTRLLGVHRQSLAMLDCMSLAGAAGIAIGRLSCLFTDANRGMVLEGITWLPIAYPVVDPVSGQQIYRLATFMLQAIYTGVIFGILLVFWLIRNKKPNYRAGDTALLFLLLHGAAQMIADSTRYDSLFMRSNGFVGMVQILGLAAFLVATVWFSVRMVRWRGFSKLYLLLWGSILVCLGLAGYMEYYVQRHGNQAALAYSLMGEGIGLALVAAVGIYILSVDKMPRKQI